MTDAAQGDASLGAGVPGKRWAIRLVRKFLAEDETLMLHGKGELLGQHRSLLAALLVVEGAEVQSAGGGVEIPVSNVGQKLPDRAARVGEAFTQPGQVGRTLLAQVAHGPAQDRKPFQGVGGKAPAAVGTAPQLKGDPVGIVQQILLTGSLPGDTAQGRGQLLKDVFQGQGHHRRIIGTRPRLQTVEVQAGNGIVDHLREGIVEGGGKVESLEGLARRAKLVRQGPTCLSGRVKAFAQGLRLRRRIGRLRLTGMDESCRSGEEQSDAEKPDAHGNLRVAGGG